MRDAIGRFSSTTLAGEPLTVPHDLRQRTLVVFAYRQWQQRDVDTWIAAVSDRDDVDVLEVPVLNLRWLPARPFIDGGMASHMDQRTRERTMCVYDSVRGFRRRVLGTNRSDVAAVLVEPDGRIVWHAYGPATEWTRSGLVGELSRPAGAGDPSGHASPHPHRSGAT